MVMCFVTKVFMEIIVDSFKNNCFYSADLLFLLSLETLQAVCISTPPCRHVEHHNIYVVDSILSYLDSDAKKIGGNVLCVKQLFVTLGHKGAFRISIERA